MITIKKTIAGFVGVAIALSLVAVVATAPVKAATEVELQAMINSLMVQINALKGGSSVSSSMSYTFTRNLTIGSRGADVTALQNFLVGKGYAIPAGATGYFGGQSKAALMSYQTAKGIAPAAGYFGPTTRLSVESMMVATAGGTQTGGTPNVALCPNGMTLSSNCMSAPGTTSGTTSTTLSGGAGDLQGVDILSTYSNEKVNEGSDDVKIMAVELEADNGSDLAIQNVKLSFKNTELVSGSSKRFNRYVDKVKVWMGNKEVGSADADDFSESSDIYSKSIVLSNAVVKRGENVKFYVSIDSTSNIDTADLNTDWTVGLDSVRFEDASRVVTTESTAGDLGTTDYTNNTAQAAEQLFSFQTLTTSGDLEVKLSEGSGNPDARVVEVDDVSDTNNVTLLEAKINAKGSKVTIDSIKFDVTPTGANANEIVKEYKLLVNGEEIDNISSPSIASTTTGQITFTDLEDDFKISKDGTVTVKLVADINNTGGAFSNGNSIVASLTSTNFNATSTTIEDENGDTVANADRSGSVVGERQTFFTAGIMVVLKGTPTAEKATGTASTTESDSGLFRIVFEVTAFGNDVFIDKSAPLVTGGAGESDLTVTGTGVLISSLTTSSGEQTPIATNGFRVAEGTTETFVITTSVLATATGFFDVQLGSLAYALTDVNATTYYTSDLSSFKTPQISLTDR